MPCSTRHRRRADHSKPHGCHPFTRMKKLRGRRNKSLQLSFCRKFILCSKNSTAQQSKAMRAAVCAVIALGAAVVLAASPHTVRVIGVIICPRPTFTFILVRSATGL
jgi:hypothetical protein